jgi:proline iminopeptidase
MKQFFLFLLTAAHFINLQGQVTDSAKTPTGPLYYHLYGKGKPVLLLSGGPGASAFMVEPIAINLSKDFQAVLFEQRGTGRSIPVPFDSTTVNLGQAIEDINTLRDKLGVEKFLIIGHSYGARLGLNYSLKYPQHVEKLVVAGFGWDSVAADNRIARASAEEREAIKKANDSIRLGIATTETIARNRKLNFRLAIYDAYKRDSLYEILAKGGPLSVKMNQFIQRDNMNPLYKVDIALVKVPTLVVNGHQDPNCVLSTSDFSRLSNKNISVQRINKSGHYPFVEQPEAFYNTVLPFLKQ